MNLVLCGFQGAGKTSWGRLLAKSVGWRFMDTDVLLLEKCPWAKGCPEVVQREGIEFFRALEREVIAELEGVKGAVIALGGGALERAQTQELVLTLGPLVYIEMSREEVMARSRLAFEETESVWARRKQVFEKLAAYRVQSEDELEKVWEKINLGLCLKS